MSSWINMSLTLTQFCLSNSCGMGKKTLSYYTLDLLIINYGLLLVANKHVLEYIFMWNNSYQCLFLLTWEKETLWWS